MAPDDHPYSILWPYSASDMGLIKIGDAIRIWSILEWPGVAWRGIEQSIL